MTVLFVGVMAVVGLVAGSAASTVASRLIRGMPLRWPAHCPQCDGILPWSQRVPVVSWVKLRGQCGRCAQGISWRYPVMELSCAVLFALFAAKVGFAPILPAYLYLVVVGAVLAAVDVAIHRLPDVLTLPSYGVLAGLVIVAGSMERDVEAILRAGVCGALMFAAYYLVAFAVPASLGFGDVKLAGLLGVVLGWVSWTAPITGTFFAFLAGGLVSLVLLLTRRVGRKTHIAFGPFMLVGAYAALLLL